MGKSNTEKLYMLENYYKFIMYRDPAERLVSVYRSKIEKPMIGLENHTPNYNWAKKDVYGCTHPHEYREWKKINGTAPIVISFSDFIDYWLNSIGKMSQDTHFLPIFDICHPCHVQFNYYGNFNAFDEDADVLIKVIGNNDTSARHSYHTNTEKTSSVAPDYYSQLSTKQKEMIVDKLARDMSFYYTIFPTEKNIHKRTMGIGYDVPGFSQVMD